MNFDEEARETIEEISDLDWLYEIGKIEGIFAQALRRAFIAGQEDMRERAAKFIGPEKPAPCDCAKQVITSHGPRWFSNCTCGNSGDARSIILWCSESNDAARIRLLPTLSGEK